MTFLIPASHSSNFRIVSALATATCCVGMAVMLVNYEWFAFGLAGMHFLVLSAALHSTSVFNYKVIDPLAVAVAAFGIGVVMVQNTFLNVVFQNEYLEWIGGHPATNTALQEIVVVVLAPALSVMHVIGTRPIRWSYFALLAFIFVSVVFVFHELMILSDSSRFDRSLLSTQSIIALYLSGISMMFGSSLVIESIVRCYD